jgi:hypothetical protein
MTKDRMGTKWRKGLIKKLTVAKVDKKFRAFYELENTVLRK